MEESTGRSFPKTIEEVYGSNVTLEKMPVVEIFLSIEGEGIRTGLPVVFVRFAGCNLRCGYCDTKYSYGDTIDKNIEHLSLNELTARIMSYKLDQVTFTGGEPLLETEYIEWFIKAFPKYTVNIETNGSIDVGVDTGIQTKNSIITMDYKCPSSGMESHMLLTNLEKLREQDVLKFVVGTQEDLDKVVELLNVYHVKCHVYLSPVFGQMDLERLANFVIKYRYLRLRVGIQIHKIIWDPLKRGV